jgi:hypothetical protein
LSGPSVDGLPDWRFDHSEPDELLAKIGAKVMSGQLDKRNENMSGREVLRLLENHRIGVGRFFSDVLGGKPTPRCESRSDGLTRFGFSKGEICEYIYAKTGVNICFKATNTSNCKLLARSLEKMREQNASVGLRSSQRQAETSDYHQVDVNDLARIAILLFSKAQLVCLKR